jgi:hypothetical protein
VKDYAVEKIGQRTAHMCWEACGHMMWNWRYRNDLGMLGRYEDKIGPFAQLDRGLHRDEQPVFYKLLELRKLKPAYGYNVRFALQWTPVIVALDSQPKIIGGHIVVVIGFHEDYYNVIDPAAGVDFQRPDGYEAVVVSRRKAEIDDQMVPQIFYW